MAPAPTRWPLLGRANGLNAAPWTVLTTQIPRRATAWTHRVTTGALLAAIGVSPDTIDRVHASSGSLGGTAECMHCCGRSRSGRLPAEKRASARRAPAGFGPAECL